MNVTSLVVKVLGWFFFVWFFFFGLFFLNTLQSLAGLELLTVLFCLLKSPSR